jgi:dissimilatory sulfite reductase related protein
MPTKQLAGKDVEVDNEGYLVNASDWNKEVAQDIARELGMTLTDIHWKAIEYARKEYEENGEAPTLRRLTKSGIISTKDLYALFPNGPAGKLAKLAGLKKPTGCI